MKIGRRRLLVFSCSLFLASTTIGCSVNNANSAGNKIISNANEALEDLFSIAPESYSIYEKSAGTLIMPKITKAGFVFGGSYGEGVLKIGGAPVDFYSVATASYGYQIGALQYSHVIFFMTEDAQTHSP
jgi:lipid-binding SYLF domain-containing protein